MEEKEYQALIDRATSVAQVNENFSGILGVLRDVVNYGSNLVPRCFVSSKRTLEDAIVLDVLVRQAIATFWFIFFLLGGDAGYRIHTKLFQISRHEYDVLNYYGMAFVKVCNFIFFLFPYIAIRMVLRRRDA